LTFAQRTISDGCKFSAFLLIAETGAQRQVEQGGAQASDSQNITTFKVGIFTPP